MNSRAIQIHAAVASINHCGGLPLLLQLRRECTCAAMSAAAMLAVTDTLPLTAAPHQLQGGGIIAREHGKTVRHRLESAL